MRRERVTPASRRRGREAETRRDVESPAIEGDEGRAPEAGAGIGYDPVCEVAPGIEKGEARSCCIQIDLDIPRVEERPQDRSDLRSGHFVTAGKNPNEFAQCGCCQRDRLGGTKNLGCAGRLHRLVTQRRAQHDVGVGCDLQRSPAQPASVMSRISSIVNGCIVA